MNRFKFKTLSNQNAGHCMQVQTTSNMVTQTW